MSLLNQQYELRWVHTAPSSGRKWKWKYEMRCSAVSLQKEKYVVVEEAFLRSAAALPHSFQRSIQIFYLSESTITKLWKSKPYFSKSMQLLSTEFT